MKYQKETCKIDQHAVSNMVKNNPAALIAEQEKQFYQAILQLTDTILAQNRRIILLTGPSSSGKTTTAKMIQKEIRARGKQVYRISLDNFYRPRDELPRWSDGFVNYESIDGLDIPHLNRLICQLQTQGSALFPIFDFQTVSRSERTFRVFMGEQTHMIFEGIHALNPLLQQFGDLKVIKLYVSVHSDFLDSNQQVLLSGGELRLIRRLLRDNVNRNASFVHTLDMWQYVLKGEEEYIHPFRQYADCHINTTHAYEPYVYRTDVTKEFSRYTQDQTHRERVLALLNKIKHFEPLDKRFVPDSSLIKEFI